MVQVFLDGDPAKTHAALEQGKRTDKSDYPPEKIAFQTKTPIWCRTQASQIGDACREVVEQLLEVKALHRLRAAQGTSHSFGPSAGCPRTNSTSWSSPVCSAWTTPSCRALPDGAGMTCQLLEALVSCTPVRR